MSLDGYYKRFPIVVRNIEELEEHLIMKLLENRNEPYLNYYQDPIKSVSCLLERSKIFSDPVGNDYIGANFITKAVINKDIELCKVLHGLGANFNFTRKVYNRNDNPRDDKQYSLFSYAKTPGMIELLLNYRVEMTEDDFTVNKYLREYLETLKSKQRLSLARVLKKYGKDLDFDMMGEVGEKYKETQGADSDIDTMIKLGETYKKDTQKAGKSKYSKKKKKTKRIRQKKNVF